METGPVGLFGHCPNIWSFICMASLRVIKGPAGFIRVNKGAYCFFKRSQWLLRLLTGSICLGVIRGPAGLLRVLNGF